MGLNKIIDEIASVARVLNDSPEHMDLWRKLAHSCSELRKMQEKLERMI